MNAIALSNPPTVREKVNPARAYLSTLANGSGRKNMTYLIERIAGSFWPGATIDTAPWCELQPQMVWEARDGMWNERRLKGTTVNLTLDAIRGVAKHAFDLGHITAETYMRIMIVKRVKDKDKEHASAPDPEWVMQFYQYTIDTDGWGVRGYEAKRLRAILGMAAGLGLRREEIVTIKYGDFTDNWYEILGKGRKLEKMRMTPFAVAAIKPWRDAFWHYARATGIDPAKQKLVCPIGKGGVLRIGEFTTPKGHKVDGLTPNGLSYIFDQAKIKACMPLEPNVGLHDLRAYFITNFVEKTGDLHAASRAARHESVETTSTYDTRAKKRADRLAAKIDILAQDDGEEG